jgi:hypothetical protein
VIGIRGTLIGKDYWGLGGSEKEAVCFWVEVVQGRGMIEFVLLRRELDATMESDFGGEEVLVREFSQVWRCGWYVE